LKEQIDRLVDQIHDNDPTMLPSLIKPDMMLCQEKPTAYSPGNPAEAHVFLEDALRGVMRQSGMAEDMQAILVDRFGENPIFPDKMESFNPLFALRQETLYERVVRESISK
jgi:hypothetical protein